jgi:branched-chain amino acid transport system substrate-binding protein
MGIAKKFGAALQNVTSVSYIKDPSDAQWASDAGMTLYKNVISKCPSCTVGDAFNIYGVAVAYTMVDILKLAGSNMTRTNVRDIAANQLNETNPFLLPGVTVHTTATDHFPITQEQVITWSNDAWHLQGSLIDERGTLK